MAHVTTHNATDYEIHIELSIIRRRDRYSGDTIAQVDHKETLMIGEDDVLGIFRDLVREAADKAAAQTGIKQTFEREMLALEAGDVVEH